MSGPDRPGRLDRFLTGLVIIAVIVLIATIFWLPVT